MLPKVNRIKCASQKAKALTCISLRCWCELPIGLFTECLVHFMTYITGDTQKSKLSPKTCQLAHQEKHKQKQAWTQPCLTGYPLPFTGTIAVLLSFYLCLSPTDLVVWPQTQLQHLLDAQFVTLTLFFCANLSWSVSVWHTPPSKRQWKSSTLRAFRIAHLTSAPWSLAGNRWRKISALLCVCTLHTGLLYFNSNITIAVFHLYLGNNLLSCQFSETISLCSGNGFTDTESSLLAFIIFSSLLCISACHLMWHCFVAGEHGAIIGSLGLMPEQNDRQFKAACQSDYVLKISWNFWGFFKKIYCPSL